MKKGIAITLVLCLLLILSAGCGNNSSNTQTLSYEKGILTETSFESEYLDLRFSVPEGFEMATEEYILDMMNIGAEVMDIDEKTLEYASLTTVYEMMVFAESGTPNVIVMVEKSPLSVDRYFDALESQLSQMGYEFDEVTTTEVAGQSYQQISSSTESFGAFLIQSYLLRKIDDRIVGFITTSTPDTEDELNVLMKAFKKY